jgi:hypothetical protein
MLNNIHVSPEEFLNFITRSLTLGSLHWQQRTCNAVPQNSSAATAWREAGAFVALSRAVSSLDRREQGKGAKTIQLKV